MYSSLDIVCPKPGTTCSSCGHDIGRIELAIERTNAFDDTPEYLHFQCAILGYDITSNTIVRLARRYKGKT